MNNNYTIQGFKPNPKLPTHIEETKMEMRFNKSIQPDQPFTLFGSDFALRWRLMHGDGARILKMSLPTITEKAMGSDNERQ